MCTISLSLGGLCKPRVIYSSKGGGLVGKWALSETRFEIILFLQSCFLSICVRGLKILLMLRTKLLIPKLSETVISRQHRNYQIDSWQIKSTVLSTIVPIKKLRYIQIML